MFLCQKCRRPLVVEVDKPLQESAILAFSSEYAIPPHLNEKYKKREVQAAELLDESFVVIPSRAAPKPPPSSAPGSQPADIAKQAAVLTNIFEIASDKTQIDHPLCTTCSDSVFTELDRKLKELEEDHQMFAACLDRMQHDPSFLSVKQLSESDKARLDDELDQQERELDAKMAQVELERATLRQDMAYLEAENKKREQLETKFWQAYRDSQLQLEHANKEHFAVRQQIKAATEQLERLKRMNVYDDAFHISHDGHFGTINGFRLGRLKSQEIDWTEINAAFGQVTLLVQTLGSLCNHTWTKYQPVPMGSFSSMVKCSDSSVCELYGSNDYALVKLFWYRRFDSALTMLLYCVGELCALASKEDPQFTFRYPIKDDMIGDVSIKFSQGRNDAGWTKALKYMLTNLKFLLVWVAKRNPDCERLRGPTAAATGPAAR